jgi:uncharacterized protein (DUF1501 family)
VVVILRGALDGLAAIAPISDPDFVRARRFQPEQAQNLLDTYIKSGDFAFHPSLTHFHDLCKSGQGLAYHAVASPYRERSHFDGQDMLESGLARVQPSDTGWLNRLCEQIAPPFNSFTSGLSIGNTPPLIMRGSAKTMGWAPSGLDPADDDLSNRLLRLYANTDPDFAKALQEGAQTAALAMEKEKTGGGPSDPQTMLAMSQGAARLMSEPQGPLICALAFEGWDTHSQEETRLARLLKGLDASIRAFQSGLGPIWDETILMVVTEFGRTVAINGSQGTDHGTASVCLMAGGRLRPKAGSTIYGDWPGLSASKLYEGRDLYPTTDLRALFMGVVEVQYGLDQAQMSKTLFPGADIVKPLTHFL